MKKIIISVLVLILIFLIALFFFSNKKETGTGLVTKEDKENIEDKDTDNKDDIKEINSKESSSGGASSIEDNLPKDKDDVECGFYYEEYNYCGGICPEGKCVNEGKSCYCKKTE